ncbi:unnamed protein product [Amoebophrya sp. A25]|nr:unnamed protein product [Amoebophrya sp. A25]|eukprot:GSA25T00006056001.1
MTEVSVIEIIKMMMTKSCRESLLVHQRHSEGFRPSESFRRILLAPSFIRPHSAPVRVRVVLWNFEPRPLLGTGPTS